MGSDETCVSKNIKTQSITMSELTPQKTHHSNQAWYVYIIRDRLNRLYTGITPDVEKRFNTHQSGKGAKFLKGMHPLELVYCSLPISKNKAAKYEYKIKQLNKKSKEKIIADKTDITQLFN